VELSLRARAAGAVIAPAPDAIVNHASSPTPCPHRAAEPEVAHLAYLANQHPRCAASFARRLLGLRASPDDRCARRSSARDGTARCSRWPSVRDPVVAPPRRAPRRRAVALAEMPGQVARQAAEVVGLAAAACATARSCC